MASKNAHSSKVSLRQRNTSPDAPLESNLASGGAAEQSFEVSLANNVQSREFLPSAIEVNKNSRDMQSLQYWMPVSQKASQKPQN